MKYYIGLGQRVFPGGYIAFFFFFSNVSCQTDDTSKSYNTSLEVKIFHSISSYNS